VLVNCCRASGDLAASAPIEAALALALAQSSSAPLLAWLDAHQGTPAAPQDANQASPLLGASLTVATTAPTTTAGAAVAASARTAPASPDTPQAAATGPAAAEDMPVFGRRAEDATTSTGPKSLKVDQSKIDRLMNLIGEMVVSKNALPYLAQRAEEQFGVRELAREIKAQYAVINRIAEEMQDAIMQVRMLPVSFVFQRFPRLVRDISRKLGKEVELVLEGEETEADKNIIESLADPLIHIVRNSLDHGLETPEVRRAAGKSATGRLTIRAVQEGDRVLIDIIDDGRGIDPQIIKRKAYEKGVIDEATLERISDRDAVNLVFAAGFSTAEVVSDLSGRGVGMDVVRTAVEKVNGSLALESVVGQGTRLRITLPLSMAVTKVMIVEADGQTFGVPMDHVVETVRVPRADIRAIKHSRSIVLRGSIVPLKALNHLLALDHAARANADDEMAVLVVKIGGESVGLIVDDFHETAEIIQKPLSGVLGGLSAYSGSALMGDGSVLMVLNVKEIV
jgi:two-component system chemotaxis sensor kinase CheA